MGEFHSITKSRQRLEAYAKAEGKAVFGNDIEMEGMLYAYGVPAAYPFALIHGIHTEAAGRAEGVQCVLTSDDIPGDKLMGEDMQDQYILAIDRVITVGDIVAVVVADTPEHAKASGRLVKVDY